MASFPLPQNEHDQKIIMDAMLQISASKTRIEGEKDYIKETISQLSEKFQIPKKQLNRFARDYHKSTFEETVSDTDEYQELVMVLQPDVLDS